MNIKLVPKGDGWEASNGDWTVQGDTQSQAIYMLSRAICHDEDELDLEDLVPAQMLDRVMNEFVRLFRLLALDAPDEVIMREGPIITRKITEYVLSRDKAA